MITMEFTGRGITDLGARISILGDAVEEAITAKMVEITLLRIPAEVQRDFDSGGRQPYVWPGNKDSTRRKKGHGRVLIETGMLRSEGTIDFEYEHPDDKTWIIYATSDYMSPRGDGNFNIWHQHYRGYHDGRDGVDRPPRPAGALSDESVEKIMDELSTAVREKMDEVLVAT